MLCNVPIDVADTQALRTWGLGVPYSRDIGAADGHDRQFSGEIRAL